MTLSHPARLMAGITLVTVPTIVYGGLTVLSVVTAGAHGLSAAGDLALSPLQTTLFRADPAHAGVLVLLSPILQILLEVAERRVEAPAHGARGLFAALFGGGW